MSGENTIEINKLKRYIFPKIDILPNKNWYLKTRKPLAIISNLIQLSLDQLNCREYDFWSGMCQRDVKFKEVSDNGYFCTNADLKKKSHNLKKIMRKMNTSKQKVKINQNQMLNIYH